VRKRKRKEGRKERRKEKVRWDKKKRLSKTILWIGIIKGVCPFYSGRNVTLTLKYSRRKRERERERGRRMEVGEWSN